MLEGSRNTLTLTLLVTLLASAASATVADGRRWFGPERVEAKPREMWSNACRRAKVRLQATEARATAPSATAAVRAHYASSSLSSGALPFELLGGTRLCLSAELNGRKTTVVLDGGAESTLLDRRFAEARGLRFEGEPGAPTADGSPGVVRGLNLALGDLTLKGVAAVGSDLSGIERQTGRAAPMVLGSEVFHECVVDLDFARRRIAFQSPSAFRTPKGAHALPVVANDGFRTVTGSVEGRPVTLEFDLGNGSPLLLFPRLWDQPGFLGGRRVSSTLSGAAGSLRVDRLAMVNDLSLGGATFTRVPTIFSGPQSTAARSGRVDGNVGLPVLSRSRLIVDYAHDRVFVVPPVDVAEPFAVDRTGLTLRAAGTGVEVVYVAAESPGDRAGLKAGDQIVEVDGVPVVSAGPNAGRATPLYPWRYGAPGTKVRLGLAQGGERVVTLADYF